MRKFILLKIEKKMKQKMFLGCPIRKKKHEMLLRDRGSRSQLYYTTTNNKNNKDNNINKI